MNWRFYQQENTGEFDQQDNIVGFNTGDLIKRRIHGDTEISESLDGVAVSISFAQSRLVLVSISIKYPSLDESRSRHPRNFSVSMSLSLNEFQSRHPRNFPVLRSLGLDIQEISQSQWVSASTSKKLLSCDESRSWHPMNFPVSMSLGLDIHKISKSRSRSRHWDLDNSVLVSLLRLRHFQSRSRWSNSSLADPCGDIINRIIKEDLIWRRIWGHLIYERRIKGDLIYRH